MIIAPPASLTMKRLACFSCCRMKNSGEITLREARRLFGLNYTTRHEQIIELWRNKALQLPSALSLSLWKRFFCHSLHVRHRRRRRKKSMQSIVLEHALFKDCECVYSWSRKYKKWRMESIKSMTGRLFFLQLGSPQHIPNIHSDFFIQPSVTSLVLRPPLPPALCLWQSLCSDPRAWSRQNINENADPGRRNTKVCFCLASISLNSEGSTDSVAPLICFCVVHSSLSLHVEVLFTGRWKSGKVRPI